MSAQSPMLTTPADLLGIEGRGPVLPDLAARGMAPYPSVCTIDPSELFSAEDLEALLLRDSVDETMLARVNGTPVDLATVDAARASLGVTVIPGGDDRLRKVGGLECEPESGALDLLRALANRPRTVRDLLAAVADEVGETEARDALAQLIDPALVPLDPPRGAQVPPAEAAAEVHSASSPAPVDHR